VPPQPPSGPVTVPGFAPAPGNATSPTLPPPPRNAVGYALPVPASLVSSNPKLIGDGIPAPRQTEPAGPVTLNVPTVTGVDAVTAGTVKVIGTSAIVLSGADGATYTYRDVTATPSIAAAPQADAAGKVPPARHVQAGDQIGTSGPGGLTFSISVPDVRGAVDADEALQAWASGLSVNVHALPSSIASVTTTAATQAKVLLVSDGGAQAAAASIKKSMSGPLIQVRTETVSDPGPVRQRDPVAAQIASSAKQQMVVVILANGTPAQAGAMASGLPAGRQLLWVAPAGTTAKQAAAYRAIVAAHPGFRVESLPAGLAGATARAANALPSESRILSPMGALATDTLTTAYVASAYSLNMSTTQADTVLAWAEEQLGKPYKWAAAGLASFDCSGLTMDALAQAGITVPHNANMQWQQTKAHPVAENHLAPGDLVFFAGADGTRAAPGHVGIYVGDGQIIDAPYTGARVRFDPVTSIVGYVGATDPYISSLPSTGNSGSGYAGVAPATGNLGAPGSVAVPGSLDQYQSFAQGLVNRTWGASQFPFLYQLWERESGWNPAALNPLSGAFGIPQALPATKMATMGLDWATNPYTQMEWGISYISAAYGDPQAAWAHEVAYGWY
jgi:cell wall-associated NlpC family hydrolase